MRLKLLSPIALLCIVALCSALLSAAEPSLDSSDFFEKQVRPVLLEQCAECHGPDVAESKLRVDSLAGLLTGGERGPAIVPGKPRESLLVAAINHDEVLQMPPKRKLSARQIRDIAKWIETGATWPGMTAAAVATTNVPAASAKITDDDRKFWSFQTPLAATLPQVGDARWPRTPLDRFLLSQLESKGVQQAPEADKRTLVRRVTFDLTGLPPTPAEVEQFVHDPAVDAYERLMDRLLASPHYGERWGRHWLDVARYADSNGMDENLAFINAYRYRDYVIGAFNRDKPYDQFVVEQLAGDLLPRSTDEDDLAHFEHLTATGLLSIGPKMLADDDPKKKEMDIIDEQLDTLGKAFLGLTLGCARCHDHKFDPLPTSDYYSLAGIFKSTQTMDDFKVVANWHENYLETKDQETVRLAFDDQLKTIDKRLAEQKKTVYAQAVERERGRTGEYLLAAAEFVHFAPASTRPKATGKTDSLAKERKLEATLLRQWVAYLSRKGQEAGSLWQPFIELEQHGASREDWSAAAQAFQAEVDRAIKAWQETKAATEGRAKQLDDPALEAYCALLYDTAEGPFKTPNSFSIDLPEAGAVVLAAIEKEKSELEKQRPPLRRAMGVRDGQVQNVRIHVRGNHTTLGPEVPRQIPQLFASAGQQSFDESQSGRLQFAHWLAQPDHPLTARVMVNRLWRWHFGRGILRSVDNFGKLGERPTNQPLLDWLAVEFVRSGWSIKNMQRLIMQSSAYRMSTCFDERAAAVDPENLLYWRFERRRLEAEEVRDSLLAISGRLDLAFGGTTISLREREYVTGTGSRKTTYNSPRRTVYLPILRSAVYDVLQAFDFADPSTLEGNRASTTVAPQALFMMNGDLVTESVSALAKSLLDRSEPTDTARVQTAYAAVLGRPAEKHEIERALRLLEAVERQLTTAPSASDNTPVTAREAAWQSLCRVLLASNEFIYVE